MINAIQALLSGLTVQPVPGLISGPEQALALTRQAPQELPSQPMPQGLAKSPTARAVAWIASRLEAYEHSLDQIDAGSLGLPPGSHLHADLSGATFVAELPGVGAVDISAEVRAKLSVWAAAFREVQ